MRQEFKSYKYQSKLQPWIEETTDKPKREYESQTLSKPLS